MTILELVRNSLSIVPLLRRIKVLSTNASSEDVVAVAMKYPAIKPQQIKSELVELAELVREQCCHCLLEIGTFRGGTLFVFSQVAAQDALLISLDYHFTFLGKLARIMQRPFFLRLIRPGQTLKLVRRDSHKAETFATIEENLQGRKLDFLFIDGDHSYEGVRADFLMYSKLVRAGGMVAFHDIAQETPFSKVPRLWEEIKTGYSHKEIIHAVDSEVLGVGVLWI